MRKYKFKITAPDYEHIDPNRPLELTRMKTLRFKTLKGAKARQTKLTAELGASKSAYPITRIGRHARRRTMSWKRKGKSARSRVPRGHPLHRIKSKKSLSKPELSSASGRKGTYNIGDIAPDRADELIHGWSELGATIKRIEVRFMGSTPEGIALVHTGKGTFVFKGNSEYATDTDFQDMGFNFRKYEGISDSVAIGVLLPLTYVGSDADLDEFKVGESQLEEIRTNYSDHTITIVTGE